MIDDILIIDDFFTPEDLAVFESTERDFVKLEEVYYAGDTSFLDKSDLAIIEKTLIKYSQLTFDNFVARMRRTDDENKADFESLIHTDHFAKVSGVVYINSTYPEQQHPFGTYFWESNLTNYKMARVDNPVLHFKDQNLVDIYGVDFSKWECWEKVSFKRNRAVFFPSNFFHSPPPPDLLRGERKTIDIFLDKKYDMKYIKRR